jgi:ribosomal protein RSM22 (predicted rRNA methylase)
MRLAILSTIEGVTWGGTEEVWVQLARLALDRGHQVMAELDYAHFDVCRAGEIRRVTVSKRQGDAWRAARDTDWGDLLDD